MVPCLSAQLACPTYILQLMWPHSKISGFYYTSITYSGVSFLHFTVTVNEIFLWALFMKKTFLWKSRWLKRDEGTNYIVEEKRKEIFCMVSFYTEQDVIVQYSSIMINNRKLQVYLVNFPSFCYLHTGLFHKFTIFIRFIQTFRS